MLQMFEDDLYLNPNQDQRDVEAAPSKVQGTVSKDVLEILCPDMIMNMEISTNIESHDQSF